MIAPEEEEAELEREDDNETTEQQQQLASMLPNLLISADSPNEETSGYNMEGADGQRKLFVWGLSWQTTEDGLKDYFESLGIAVDKVIIMRDKITGRSRGFGFVTVVRVEDIDKAVNSPLHLGRKIEAKRAIPKREMDYTARKLFVGGVPISLSNVSLRQYFEAFGPVADAQIMTERYTGHSRGFGFVTFEDDEGARNALKARHIIQGKTVEVKKAQPKKIEQTQPIHIVHPYPMPFYPPYQMYAPAPMYAPPAALYQPPMTYDPYFMGQLGGVIYSPQYVDAPYGAHIVPNPQTSVSPSRGSVSRKNSEAYTQPALVRPHTNQSRLYANLPRSSLSLVAPERTERAFSAGYMAGSGFQPSVTASVFLSPINNNARKRGMSHPPIKHNRRQKSHSSNPTSPVPVHVSLHHTAVHTTRRGSQPKDKDTGLHKYFQ